MGEHVVTGPGLREAAIVAVLGILLAVVLMPLWVVVADEALGSDDFGGAVFAFPVAGIGGMLLGGTMVFGMAALRAAGDAETRWTGGMYLRALGITLALAFVPLLLGFVLFV